jgi:hypothetical protein
MMSLRKLDEDPSPSVPFDSWVELVVLLAVESVLEDVDVVPDVELAEASRSSASAVAADEELSDVP